MPAGCSVHVNMDATFSKNNQLIRADDCKYCVTHPHILISFCGRIGDGSFRPRHVSNSLMHFLMMSMALMKASLKSSNDSTIGAAKDFRVTWVTIWSAKAGLLLQVLSTSFHKFQSGYKSQPASASVRSGFQ